MDNKAKRIGDRLFGDVEHFSFEERIFNFALLLAIFLTAFGTVMNVYYGAEITIDLAFVGCWGLSYYLSRFKGYFSIITVISAGIFVFAFLPYNWISSGGSGSVLPYYSILFIAMMSIILKGSFRIAVVISILVVEALLICRDANLAGSFHTLFYRNLNLIDLSLHLGIILASTAVLIIVYSNTYMKEKSRNEEYAKAIEENYKQQLYYMENLEQLIYRLKAERHDFNNHLGVMYGLLANGETEKAGHYAGKLVKAAEEFQSIVSIPYSMMRAMLNYKLSAAKENKIELRLDIQVPEKLELNEFDLTVILGNLLDNAMEACAALEESRRYIDLRILYRPDYLIIQIENPVKRNPVLQGGKNRTTKSDEGNHGFGLSNIEYLVNKYNGLMKIEPEDGIFKVDIAILADGTLSK